MRPSSITPGKACPGSVHRAMSISGRENRGLGGAVRQQVARRDAHGAAHDALSDAAETVDVDRTDGWQGLLRRKGRGEEEHETR
jgi:hypothetical protein